MDDTLLVLTGHDVLALLEGRDLELIDAVREAYEAHARGATSLPHSVFLTFPDNPRNRIIGLPAHVGGEPGLAGIKWISSFPANVSRGLERASAVIVLNSMEDGRPVAVIEGSVISARRTAASAALAVRSLHGERRLSVVGVLGCGRINLEITRFLHAARDGGWELLAWDLDPERAGRFAARCEASLPGVTARVAAGPGQLLEQCPLVSIATTAATPHVHDLSMCPAGATILHVSLRDIAPEAIAVCDNVVDDPDHVCRAQTSLHLLEQRRGDRGFIRCSLGEVLTGAAPPRRSADGVTVFSPFGLGILDLVVAARVHQAARRLGVGTPIRSFLPPSLAD